MLEASLQHTVRTWSKPVTVYEPMKYGLSSGGKRLRGVLVMLSAAAVGGRVRDAIHAAVAVEMLHNFTLIHDDVMDHAPMRRGIPTIHRKWDENVAILAGDTLLAKAYESLLQTTSHKLSEVAKEFTGAFLEVCEGQALDKEFECRTSVGLPEYYAMIGKKTARMISSAAVIGGVVGNASKKKIQLLRKFGKHLGLAFQIQDDVLDIIGDEMKFGKKIGGDIIEGKKTFLLLAALARARGEEKKILESVVPGNPGNERKVPAVREIYIRLGAVDGAHREILRQTTIAQNMLSGFPDLPATSELLAYARSLAQRRV